MTRGYRTAAVLTTAADLDLFSPLSTEPMAASALARKLECDPRGLTILLDALAAMELLVKQDQRYSLAPGADTCLTASGSNSILAMAQHQANCLRRWAQLARVVKTGEPAERTPQLNGQADELESFIGAMDNISAPLAPEIIRAVQPLEFRHLLDVGGASGTWTLAFLNACETGTATLFDLPDVLPLARRRLTGAGMEKRVTLEGGDFLKDTLPGGADLAWVSAIVHQNSREQNRRLFANVFQALVPGGRIAIRDMVMETARTRPVAGALFAVNMLVATEGGGTFTFQELSEDLAAAGFTNPAVVRRDQGMNSIVLAEKASTH